MVQVCSDAPHSGEKTLDTDENVFERLIYGPRVMAFYEELLGGPALHYDFTWFRPIGPGRGTAPHCDLVYMGRGTRQVFTMWVPYGDVSLNLGGLILKTRMEGPKIASFCSGVSICGSMGSHPEGPSRSDGISLMLSRLRRFDSRHSRF
jgi:hypothetical protein